MLQLLEWVQVMIHLQLMNRRNMDLDANCPRNFPRSNYKSKEIIMMIIYLHKFIVMTLIMLLIVSRAVLKVLLLVVVSNGIINRSIKRSRILSTMSKKTRRFGSESSIGMVEKTLRNLVNLD